MSSCFRRLGIRLGCIKADRPETRTVYVNNKPLAHDDVIIPEIFPDNRVTSSKYTAWNFLPKNLFEQFRRIVNFYFLCISIILFIIDTPVTPATSVTPLVFVVGVTAIKQAYEDWLRHKADKEVNNRPSQVLRDGKFTEVKALDIKVGDIVCVKVNHGFPADMVLLSSHDPEGGCYVTTANLDGETNLKTFVSVAETHTAGTTEELEAIHATIECEQPKVDLYTFFGRISFDGQNGALHSLTADNLLLRGTRLRNTQYIYGCVVYTGQETKIALNSKITKTKFSSVEKSMNRFILTFLLILFVESILLTILHYWYIGNHPHPWYLSDEPELSVRSVVEDFFSFLVIINYIVPISLYVTVEIQKFISSMFFGWDLQMYDPVTEQAAIANTSDLNEELGQVEYLFTDKTGTLTENDMQFKECSINSQRYIEIGGMLCRKSDVDTEQPEPVRPLTDEVEMFLRVLVLCHSVRVDHPERHTVVRTSAVYSNNGFDYEYQASSPDEKAFLEACRNYGVVYHGVHDERLEVTFHGEMRRYKLLHTLDFDANRKRMSVIVQDEADKIWLLCKGADTAILDRVVAGDKHTTLHHVNEYALLGLRTLTIAQRTFTPEQYEEVNQLLYDAKTELIDREKRVSESYDMVETDLTLLGATAVEDKLQEGVSDTIEALTTAGIKIWVLTGDKEETAVNVSYSAGHFKHGMQEIRVTRVPSGKECNALIRRHIEHVQYCQCQDSSSQSVLIVDGPSLTIALKNCERVFVELCHMCTAVLCCRMLPLQKAEIVKLIKSEKNGPVTCAIGDGANDVSMIQEAHVGLGIMGKEGRQAVRCSDYAFSRFRFLLPAFLVHGHLYYIRISTLVHYFFYKNVAFMTPQIFYAFFSAFSGMSLYESFFLMFYNITFTSLPILVYGCFEQHVKPRTLLIKPRLYKDVSHNTSLSIKKFMLWNGIGLWHSVVSFFAVYFAVGDDRPLDDSGQLLGNWSFGAITCVMCVIIVNLKLAIETYYWCVPVICGFLISIIGFYALTFIYSAVIWDILMDDHWMYWVIMHCLNNALVWLCMLVIVITALLPDILIRTWRDGGFGQPYRKLKRARKQQNYSSKDKYRSSSLVPLMSTSPGHSMLQMVQASNHSRSWNCDNQTCDDDDDYYEHDEREIS